MQQANARKDAPAGDAPAGLCAFGATETDHGVILPSAGGVVLIRFPQIFNDPLGWHAGSDTNFICPKAGYYDIIVTVAVDSPHAADTYGIYFKLTTPNCVVSSGGINTGVAIGRDVFNLRAFDFFSLGNQLFVQGAQYGASGLGSPDVGQANNYLTINPIG